MNITPAVQPKVSFNPTAVLHRNYGQLADLRGRGKPSEFIQHPSERKTAEHLSPESRASAHGCPLKSGASKRTGLSAELIMCTAQLTVQKLRGGNTLLGFFALGQRFASVVLGVVLLLGMLPSNSFSGFDENRRRAQEWEAQQRAAQQFDRQQALQREANQRQVDLQRAGQQQIDQLLAQKRAGQQRIDQLRAQQRQAKLRTGRHQPNSAKESETSKKGTGQEVRANSQQEIHNQAVSLQRLEILAEMMKRASVIEGIFSEPIPEDAIPEYLVAHPDYPPGYQPRIDRLVTRDFVIIEVIPAHLKRKGDIEAQQYAQWMDRLDPLLNGEKWRWKTITYDQGSLTEYFQRIGFFE
jgi:hypothetical protein